MARATWIAALLTLVVAVVTSCQKTRDIPLGAACPGTYDRKSDHDCVDGTQCMLLNTSKSGGYTASYVCSRPCRNDPECFALGSRFRCAPAAGHEGTSGCVQ
jgi:hypothetical protein